MKRTIAAILAILMLSGCSVRKEPAETREETTAAETITETAVEETEEAPVEETPEEVPEEVPVEILPEIQEEEPAEEWTEEAPEGAVDTYAVTTDVVEGLVGDAVGYTLEKPSFEGFPSAETVNGFYTDLVDQLEGFSRETVNSQCMERACVASVYGSVVSTGLTSNNLELEVVYEYRVEYSDTEEPTIHTRTDWFHVQTGEVRSETE